MFEAMGVLHFFLFGVGHTRTKRSCIGAQTGVDEGGSGEAEEISSAIAAGDVHEL